MRHMAAKTFSVLAVGVAVAISLALPGCSNRAEPTSDAAAAIPVTVIAATEPDAERIGTATTLVGSGSAGRSARRTCATCGPVGAVAMIAPMATAAVTATVPETMAAVRSRRLGGSAANTMRCSAEISDGCRQSRSCGRGARLSTVTGL